MKIGIPKEIKAQEHRVGMTPHNLPELVDAGHEIIVERDAGLGSGFSDEEYVAEGARVVQSHREVFQQADMIVKVKEPLDGEFDLFQPDQILFTYLHLASSESLTRRLLQTKIIGIAYETVEEDGRLPLLAPMSVIAGRMAPIMGGYFLAKHAGGMGTFFGGASGIPHSEVVIIGGGVAGLAAAKVASGVGPPVTILEVNSKRITYLEDICPANVAIIMSNKYNIRTTIPKADILIGAVLIPGARAPKLVSHDLVREMKPGSVIVDIAIDQGGCIETSRPTTHENPVFVEERVVHYCVANMPGAYPRTSTMALTNSTSPFVLAIANAERDWSNLLEKKPSLEKGFNIFGDQITCGPVADAFGLDCKCIHDLV